MRTVGSVLKEAREAKFYTLEEVEKSIKIRVELLQALEVDDYSKLPPATFVQGFIKNYGKFLGIENNKLQALFRRDYETKNHPPVVLESFKRPIGGKRVIITPSRLLGIVVGIIVLSFFVYLWVEYRQFAGAPKLTVTSPQDQQTVEIPSVTVEGNTDPEVKIAVNNQEIGTDKNGYFKEEIKLSSSNNIVTISATGKFGQVAKVERKVFVKK